MDKKPTTLRDYVKNHVKRGKGYAEFAEQAGTTKGQLIQITNGNRVAGLELAIQLERVTRERPAPAFVPVEVSRPDIPWAVIRDNPFT